MNFYFIFINTALYVTYTNRALTFEHLLTTKQPNCVKNSYYFVRESTYRYMYCMNKLHMNLSPQLRILCFKNGGILTESHLKIKTKMQDFKKTYIPYNLKDMQFITLKKVMFRCELLRHCWMSGYPWPASSETRTKSRI
jgi:hypothetical protein